VLQLELEEILSFGKYSQNLYLMLFSIRIVVNAVTVITLCTFVYDVWQQVLDYINTD